MQHILLRHSNSRCCCNNVLQTERQNPNAARARCFGRQFDRQATPTAAMARKDIEDRQLCNEVDGIGEPELDRNDSPSSIV